VAIDLATPALAGPAESDPDRQLRRGHLPQPGQKFLVVCDGSAIHPSSVIDVATQTEISTFPLGPIATRSTSATTAPCW
jgi:hypothetical protein